MSLAYRAMLFARDVHKDQRRKYTGNPYVDHLAEVAGILSVVLDGLPDYLRETATAVAWLHDCVEDCEVKASVLRHEFGEQVLQGVMLLSDLESGNRVERKAASCARLATAPFWVQTIKCADLISNTSSIVLHDPDFAVTYLKEKRNLLNVLINADQRLIDVARAQAAP